MTVRKREVLARQWVGVSVPLALSLSNIKYTSLSCRFCFPNTGHVIIL